MNGACQRIFHCILFKIQLGLDYFVKYAIVRVPGIAVLEREGVFRKLLPPILCIITLSIPFGDRLWVG